MPLPKGERDETGDGHDDERDDEVRAKPIIFLAFVEEDLQCADAEYKQGEPERVKAHFAGFDAAQEGRVIDEFVDERKREQTDRQVDEKNPAPRVVVGNPAADDRTERGGNHDGDSEKCKGGGAFAQRERVGHDGLGHGLHAAAACTLKDAGEEQDRHIGSESAEQRTGDEERDADQEETLTTDGARYPADHGKNDCIGDEVGGQDPGGLILAGSKAAGNVRERDVGDAGVEDLHKRSQCDGDGDDPGIESRDPFGCCGLEIVVGGGHENNYKTKRFVSYILRMHETGIRIRIIDE